MKKCFGLVLMMILNVLMVQCQSLETIFNEADVQTLKNLDSCFSICDKGIALAKVEKNKEYEASFLTLKGKAFYFNGQYDSAAFYYNQSIRQLEQIKATQKLAFTYNELAKLYRRTKKYEKALENYEKALLIYQKISDSVGIGMIYNERGVVYEYQKKYDEAILNYRDSYDIALRRNDLTGQAYALNYIGNTKKLQGKLSDASNFLEQAIALQMQVKDTFAMGWCYADLSEIYLINSNLKEADESLINVYSIAKKLHIPDLMSKYYLQKSIADSIQGNYLSSSNYYKKYIELKDSIFNTDNNKIIEELNTKYQTSKKEQLIHEQDTNLRVKNILLIASFLLLGLAILLGYSYFQRRKLKEQKRLQSEILKQQDLSTKAVIEAEEKERVRIAADLHDGIGQLLSAAKMNLHAVEENFTDSTQKNILEKAISLVDESAKEIRSVSHNIMPNALIKSGLGFAVKDFIQKLDNKKLQVNVNATGLNEKLNTNIEIVVYRIIQECVNNVIKHAKANRLDISLINENDFLEIMIEDNGVGFDVEKALSKDGIGLKNIKTRVEYLKGTIDIDSQINNGTMMAIHIPLSNIPS